jgi:hypothetical protein
MPDDGVQTTMHVTMVTRLAQLFYNNTILWAFVAGTRHYSYEWVKGHEESLLSISVSFRMYYKIRTGPYRIVQTPAH